MTIMVLIFLCAPSPKAFNDGVFTPDHGIELGKAKA